jgi:hypothetical protein
MRHLFVSVLTTFVCTVVIKHGILYLKLTNNKDRLYSQFASFQTTSGLFPPSSSVTRLRFDLAAATIMACPT